MIMPESILFLVLLFLNRFYRLCVFYSMQLYPIHLPVPPYLPLQPLLKIKENIKENKKEKSISSWKL